MLEFNSDTPTGIVEAFYVNGRVCEYFGAEDPNEGCEEHLRLAFRHALDTYRTEGYATDHVVFSALDWHEEDAGTTRYLLDRSGLDGHFVPLSDLRVEGERMTALVGGASLPVDVLYRLHALEILAEDRDDDGYPTGAHALELIARRRVAVINPPGALLSQTKAMQALIWALHEAGEFFDPEEHRIIETYMLPTYLENRFRGIPHVTKPIFGREGAGVTLYDARGLRFTGVTIVTGISHGVPAPGGNGAGGGGDPEGALPGEVAVGFLFDRRTRFRGSWPGGWSRHRRHVFLLAGVLCRCPKGMRFRTFPMTLFAERGPAEDALKTRKLNGKGDDQMFDQWSNILNFLMYLGVTLPLLGVGIAVFLFTTPYKEFQLIRDGADTTDPQKRRRPRRRLTIWEEKSSAFRSCSLRRCFTPCPWGISSCGD